MQLEQREKNENYKQQRKKQNYQYLQLILNNKKTYENLLEKLQQRIREFSTVAFLYVRKKLENSMP